jgi:type 1 glutamine amidotransferase
MRITVAVLMLAAGLPAVHLNAAPPVNKKRILVIGQTKGFQHDSVSDAMGSIWKMGRDTGLWDTYLRTDTELLTKGKVGPNGKNLDEFNLVVFASTTGELDLTEQQKKDFLAFVHDDGKGFVGIHAALDTNYKWPEYGELIGAWFDNHPWGTFWAPMINEDTNSPITGHLPAGFVKRDEIYQASKEFARDKVHVLLRLDESKLDYSKPAVKRADHDFAVAWTKMYGKGRVFYSTLGHTNESWNDPDVYKMYFEAIKWALGLTEDNTKPHPRTTPALQ